MYNKRVVLIRFTSSAGVNNHIVYLPKIKFHRETKKNVFTAKIFTLFKINFVQYLMAIDPFVGQILNRT